MTDQLPLIALLCFAAGAAIVWIVMRGQVSKAQTEMAKMTTDWEARLAQSEAAGQAAVQAAQASVQMTQVRVEDLERRLEQTRQEQLQALGLAQNQLAQLKAQGQLSESQKNDYKDQLARAQEQLELRLSRLRDMELELERLKLLDASRGDREMQLRALEVEHNAVVERLQNESAQRQLLDSRLADNYQTLQQMKQDYERRLMERETELRGREQHNKDLLSQVSRLDADLRSAQQKMEANVQTLTLAHDELNRERQTLREETERRRQESFERRRANWVHHENGMIDLMKNLCKRLEVVYHDKKTFPLQKKPDFAIEVAGQFVIFDAKAPGDPEHPENFYEYLKRQAEALDKYLKQEGVRREGFLVVPTDSLPYLQEKYFFEIGGNKIFVVSPEGLEPTLRLLLKMEEYELAQALGPEAQDEIATFVGQASRLMKRRVQIDHFMSDKFIELMKHGESLPEEILLKAQSKEKNFQFNPPKLDRGKGLSRDELDKKQTQLGFMIEGMDINASVGQEAIEAIPLTRTARIARLGSEASGSSTESSSASQASGTDDESGDEP